MKLKLQRVIRALKIIMGLPRPALISQVINIMVAAPLPFMNIWFSARIVNELATDRNRDRLFTLIAIFIALQIGMHIVTSIINRWAQISASQNRALLENLLTQKMFSADFKDLEDPAFQLEYSTVRDHLNGMGHGLTSVYNTSLEILRASLQVIISIAFAFHLFLSPVPTSSPLAWLSHPLVVIAMLGLIITNIFISPYLITLAQKIWIKAADVNNIQTRFASFYLWSLCGVNETAKDIRIYDQTRMVDKTADAALLDVNKWMPFYKYAAKYGTLSRIVGEAIGGMVYVYVAVKAFAGAFGVGMIVQYVGAINQFTAGLTWLFSCFGTLSNNDPFLERCFKFLDTPEETAAGSDPMPVGQYQFEFKNVSFKYPGSDQYALKNLNLKLDIGQRLAIVGMNGSGKTTLVKLLTRLYDPTQGEILLNGKNIKAYNYQAYLEAFGIVFQDHAHMCFTLGQNVAASHSYDAAAVTKALDQAGFSTRLASLPYGLDTYLQKWFTEKGVEMSGGEIQKIVLARALYKNAPIIVLDEPTAALDPIAEYEIYTRFNEIVEDKTAIYISHRLSSCKFCDRIIVFDAGELVEDGVHDTLVACENGKYQELWTAQAQYYA